ncbi:acetylxylan esterase [Prosthecobacter sp.]|uniref:glucuronyl esterase domain-containing protein n=1 Tax=Prosthecobacter sp. TaxID=1965333 RepID=UPI00248A7E9C|nr:acetylxylan esterase [Prosthecobacter sp.]MDI1314334.1 acetylxylan esterase [Prosthecobacter sp.]
MRTSLFFLLAASALAQSPRPGVNYDEAKVGSDPLPDLKLTTADAWTNKRRPEILKLFEDHVYGKTPADIGTPKFEVTATKSDALGGLATRKFIHISLPNHPAWPGMDVMLYTPNAVKAAPCFVGLSFGGNHAVSTEADVPLSTRWMRESKEKHIVDHHATEATRGTESSRWPLEMILKRGFAVATAYYGDIEPDRADGWKESLRAAVSKEGANTVWKAGEWGAIGAWSWGLSRIADYLQTDAQTDGKHLAVIGHSRLGKTSLWAGAQDTRFGVVISNDSGEGGAALMRRDFGETTAIITKAFPHWFTPNYADYAGNAAACPVDMHMLIALAAPRPIYIASAAEDHWADQKGEFLSGKFASPVYALFDKKGVVVDAHPAIDTPVGDFIGYHVRTGKHDVTDFDWTQYLDFAARHWAK